VKKTLVLTVAVVMVVIGAVWTFQGLGVIGGSPMSGVETWAIVGPVVAGLGVALAIVGLSGSRR